MSKVTWAGGCLVFPRQVISMIWTRPKTMMHWVSEWVLFQTNVYTLYIEQQIRSIAFPEHTMWSSALQTGFVPVHCQLSQKTPPSPLSLRLVQEIQIEGNPHRVARILWGINFPIALSFDQDPPYESWTIQYCDTLTGPVSVLEHNKLIGEACLSHQQQKFILYCLT